MIFREIPDSPLAWRNGGGTTAGKGASGVRLRPQLDAGGEVHLHQVGGCATDRGDPGNGPAAEGEVLIPLLPARVEQRHDRPGVGVEGHQVRPLV
jgi:hypothetical protein